MDKINMGVIGLGFGQHHVRTLANMEDAHLVAVADKRFEGLEPYAEQYGAKAYRSGVAMIEQEDLDAVSLCVGPGFREELITAAVNKDIAMFIEKPWATNVLHAQRLADICQAADVITMVGFSFRFHPVVVKLRELMDSELGKGWMLNAEYVFSWLPPAEHWLWDLENGNGFFNENSCHLLDVVRYLLGDAVSLTAEGGVYVGRPSEEAVAVSMRFASSAVASVTLGGIGSPGFHDYPRLDIITENGQAHLTGRQHIWESLTWATRTEGLAHTFTAPPESLGNTRYTNAMQHFFDCIKTGKTPKATIEDGIKSVELAMAIGDSLRSGNKVHLA